MLYCLNSIESVSTIEQATSQVERLYFDVLGDQYGSGLVLPPNRKFDLSRHSQWQELSCMIERQHEDPAFSQFLEKLNLFFSCHLATAQLCLDISEDFGMNISASHKVISALLMHSVC